jgi:chromosome partitioning protein
MYDARTNLSIQVVEEVKKYIDDNIYTAIIPRNVRLSEAPSHGLPITLYDKSSKGAESYLLLAKELIERDERKWQ